MESQRNIGPFRRSQAASLMNVILHAYACEVTPELHAGSIPFKSETISSSQNHGTFGAVPADPKRELFDDSQYLFR